MTISEHLFSTFLPEWLPGDIESAVGTLNGRVEDLYPEEAAMVANAIASRQIEFATGRLLARDVLARLECEPAPLLCHPDHSPTWPSGVIGSIAHTMGSCAVAIARPGSRVLGVGIDIEQDAPLEDRVTKYVLSEREQRWLEALPDPTMRAKRAMVVFSAKEAIYKCMHPVGNAGLRFRDVELEITSAKATIAVRLGPELARRVTWGTTIACGFAVKNGFIETAAVLKN